MQRITLRSEGGPGSRHLSAQLSDDGELEIYGHDRGSTVTSVFGQSEYEWTWTVKAEHVPLLVAALGGAYGEPVLDVLARECSDDNAARLSKILGPGKAVPADWWHWRSDWGRRGSAPVVLLPAHIRDVPGAQVRGEPRLDRPLSRPATCHGAPRHRARRDIGKITISGQPMRVNRSATDRAPLEAENAQFDVGAPSGT